MAKTKIVIDDHVLDEIIRQVANDQVHTYVIHDGVEYGIYQETTERGHPSLVPAFERIAKTLPRAIGKAVEMAVSIDNILSKAAFDIQRLWATDVNVDTGAYKNSITVSKE